MASNDALRTAFMSEMEELGKVVTSHAARLKELEEIPETVYLIKQNDRLKEENNGLREEIGSLEAQLIMAEQRLAGYARREEERHEEFMAEVEEEKIKQEKHMDEMEKFRERHKIKSVKAEREMEELNQRLQRVRAQKEDLKKELERYESKETAGLGRLTKRLIDWRQ